MSSGNTVLGAAQVAIAPESLGSQAPVPKLPSFVLTTSCPDTTGVVAAVAGFLAAHNCLITEAQHYDDPYTVTSFMRTVFHDNGKGAPTIADLDREFAKSVGAQFNMSW